MNVVKELGRKIKIYINKVGAKRRNKKLKCNDFTIISNNCYAGLKYEHIGMKFTSPTIGLYFFAPDYIKFIKNLKHYCTCKLEIINPSNSKYFDELKKRKQTYKIIGKIDDIEIVFLHYKSEKDAIEKWKKRCKRINYDYIIYKFNDQNLCTYEELKEFHNFQAKNKICFTAKKYEEFPEMIQIKKYEKYGYVKDDSYFNDRYLNFINFLRTTKRNGEKTTILHVLNKMHMGGAETLVINLYRNINKNKYTFVFAVSKKGYYDKEIEKNMDKIIIVPEFKIFNYFSYRRFWKEFFINNSYIDIVHAHIRGSAAIFLKIARQYGIKTISHSHSISNGNGIKAFFKNCLKSKIKHNIDIGIGCSKDANVWLFGKKFANSEKCYVLFNGIDMDKFKYSNSNRLEIRNKIRLNNDDYVIGHVGRFVDVKNHEFLLNLFNNKIKKYKNVKMVLVGDGPLKDKIRDLIYKMNLQDRVFILDSTNEIYKYYSAFDIFMFPSKFEGLGITLVEAQASGLKCIASSSIPRDVKITNNIDFLALDIEQWSTQFLKDKESINKRTVKFLSDKYDIRKSVNDLEKIYDTLIRR